MHASVKSHAEIELGRFSRSPDISLVLLHDSSINQCHSSESEISWDSELPRELVSTHWELDSVVETNIAIDTLAESLVGHLCKRNDLAVLTVALSRLLGLDGLVEGGDVRNHIRLPLEGLNVERASDKLRLLSLSGFDGVLARLGVVGHSFFVSSLFNSAGTDLVAPFLVAAVVLGALPFVVLVELTLAATVILGEVALEFLGVTIIGTSFSFSIDQGKTVVLLLIMIVLDGVMPSRELGTELVVAFHRFADVASSRLGLVVVEVVSCKV